MGVSHLILIGALAIAAGQAVDSKAQLLQPAEPGRELTAPAKNPYRWSFQTLPVNPSTPPPAVLAPNAEREQPRIVCGLVVVPVKPAADPKMILQPNQDRKPDFKIRTIAPRICNE